MLSTGAATTRPAVPPLPDGSRADAYASAGDSWVAPRDERALRSALKCGEWLSAIPIVATALALGVGRAHRVELLGMIGAAVAMVIFYLVIRFVQMPPRRAYDVMDCALEVAAVAVIAVLVYWTGGAASPFIPFMFYPVLYVATFWTARSAIALTAWASLATLAPEFYDASAGRYHTMARETLVIATFGALLALITRHKGRLLAAEQQARVEALTDPLTGVLNRRGLTDRATSAVSEVDPAGHDRSEPRLAVVAVDVDNFKETNSLYGHAGGDLVLRVIASTLRREAGDAFVGRLGGDEFAIVASGLDRLQVERLAERCVSAVGAATTAAAAGLADDARLSISVGYALASSPHTSFDQLLGAADKALYAVKAAGKGGSAPSEIPAFASPIPPSETTGTGHRHGRGDEAPARASLATASTKEQVTVADATAPLLWGRSRLCLYACAAWLGTSSIVLLSELVPDAERTHLGLLLVCAGIGVLVALITFTLAAQAGTAYYTVLSLLTSMMAVGLIYLTGGVFSSMLPLIFLIVAFAASFAPPRVGALRIGVATLTFATPLLYTSAELRTGYLLTFTVLAIASLIIAASIMYNKTLLVRARNEAEDLSLTDALTGVSNRRAFDRELALLTSGGRTGEFALCVVDLDNFKQINTMYGHAGGDELLHAAAAELVRAVRADDFVARIGGDEFAIILPRTGAHDARAIADRCVASVRTVVEDPRWSGSDLSASVGYCMYPHDGDSADPLIQAADEALMKVKLSGKNAAQCSRPVAQAA